jgi:hypothetical protein
MTKTKNTVADFKAELEAAGIKLASLCGNISTLEAGAMQSVSANGKKLAATYAVMYSFGIRPSDYITPKSKGSTATAEQWDDRYAVASRLCYSPAELAELDAPIAKDATLEQKAARKALQERKKDLMRTIKRGLTTQDKKQNPEAYELRDARTNAKLHSKSLRLRLAQSKRLRKAKGCPNGLTCQSFAPSLPRHVKSLKFQRQQKA